MAALEGLQSVAQVGFPRGYLEFVANFIVEPLQLVALPSQVGTLARHLDLHFAHLLHEGLFILLQLVTGVLKFFAQGKKFFLVRQLGGRPGLELLHFRMLLPNEFRFLLEQLLDILALVCPVLGGPGRILHGLLQLGNL